ncbi:MAG: Zn-dependent hydrolase [Bacteroidetes bacterium]|nr:Zn-dependent hydrolase [Bacteroidota bacterium]
MKNQNYFLLTFLALMSLGSCKQKPKEEPPQEEPKPSMAEVGLSKYVSVKLTTDISKLSESERKMIPFLIKAAKVMDELFWMQAYGDKSSLMSDLQDESEKLFADLNYGPWDRLENNQPFIEGVGEKPKGANLYPQDVTQEELDSAGPAIKDQYSMVRRDDSGKLKTIPYHEFFADKLKEASGYLLEAAKLCESPELKKYLELRAAALLSDQFLESDKAWIAMKDNAIDIIIGPIENYEDHWYSAKTSYEAYVLVKDKEWSERLKKYVALLPELQKSLPVDEKYKKESPGSSSQLNAYDVIYYAGDCNAGSKTIAVNLPNDEIFQTTLGTRRSQLKNAMRAKFDRIMLPISDVLIDESQRKHVTFNAFFENTMFHEVAHGLGIKNTLNGGTVRDALGAESSALEEGKADILGLYMVTYLRDKGILTDGELMDNYVTFLAGIFRSVRFGAASAHGKANMVRFNFFKEKGAFVRNENGTYSVDMEKMRTAMNDLSALIITLQGNGDKAGVEKLTTEKGMIDMGLQSDLDRLATAGIPVDVFFEQGVEVLGLN